MNNLPRLVLKFSSSSSSSMFFLFFINTNISFCPRPLQGRPVPERRQMLWREVYVRERVHWTPLPDASWYQCPPPLSDSSGHMAWLGRGGGGAVKSQRTVQHWWDGASGHCIGPKFWLVVPSQTLLGEGIVKACALITSSLNLCFLSSNLIFFKVGDKIKKIGGSCNSTFRCKIYLILLSSCVIFGVI